MRVEHLHFVLGIVGFVVLVVIWNRAFNWLCLKMSDWPSLAAQFPWQPFSPPRKAYKGLTGATGKLRMMRGFSVELSEEGLKITPRFAKTLPLFVPWPRLVSVESVRFSILVTLDSDTWFYLPKDAFDSIRLRVRPEVLK